MVKVQKTPNNQLIITIPKKIAEFKGIEKGMEVVFREHGKHTLMLELSRETPTTTPRTKPKKASRS